MLARRKQHGKRHTKTYKSWADMIVRCTKPNSVGYPNYGGRGVKVCAAWFDFRNFYADMGDCPYGYSLDRIDPNGNYEKANCRWADRLTQAQNTRLRRANKSGLHGVWWYEERKAYKPCIYANGKLIHLGQTPDFFEACCRRKSAELIYHKGASNESRS